MNWVKRRPDRHVKSASGTWESKRIVLARERVGFSLHETTLYAGTETSMWYANHVEAVVCVEGEAELTDQETGRSYTITPGTMYLLDGHERLAGQAIEHVEVALLGRLDERRHRPAIGRPVEQHRLRRHVVVPDVVVDGLEVPGDAARSGL